MVDVARFELAASSLRTKRSSRLIYTPSGRPGALLALAFTSFAPFKYLRLQATSMKDRFALLVRCNPQHWRWGEKIPADGSEADIEWTCSLKPGSVDPMTPVFVLGTGGSGFLAVGSSVSDIRMTEGDSDNSWETGHKHRGGPAMRMLLRLRRNQLAENHLRNSTLDYLINRQSTFTWLTEEEALGLESLMG